MKDKSMRFLETHEWAAAEGGVAAVGISDFAVGQLGDIVFLELPKAGTKVKKGSALGVIESVKAASDVYAPVSGEVVEVNGALADNLDWFKQEPFGRAWLVKIKMSDPGEFESLLDEAGYRRTLEGQGH